MTKDQSRAVLSLFKALGNQVRLDILRFLISGEKCVCKIFEHLNLSQNLVSHHLGILRENELIQSRKDGKWVHYSLNTAHFESLKDFANDFASVQNIKTKSQCDL